MLHRSARERMICSEQILRVDIEDMKHEVLRASMKSELVARAKTSGCVSSIPPVHCIAHAATSRALPGVHTGSVMTGDRRVPCGQRG